MQTRLGQKAQDQITGFTGIITGKVEYLTGCRQVLLAPRTKPGGELVASQWFDEDRIKVTVETPLKLRVTADGPDRQAPIR